MRSPMSSCKSERARSIAELAEEYDILLRKLDRLIATAAPGTSHLVSPKPVTFKVHTTRQGGKLTIPGLAADSASLGLRPAGNSWNDPQAVADALNATHFALARLAEADKSFAAAKIALDAAQAFNREDEARTQAAMGMKKPKSR